MIITLCLPSPVLPASAATNILFILDVSGSMAGKVGNVAKIDTAKAELHKLLGDLIASGDNAGLMLYGHRSKSDCEDVQLVSPIGSMGFSFLSAKPLGKTPIAFALAQSAAAFAGREGQNNNIVLISDGTETCGGDPCAAAASLRDKNIGVRVDVIGFALNEGDQKQLQCIAERGGGKFFSADDTSGFGDAINAAVRVAEEPSAAAAPLPPPSKTEAPRKVVFSEEFEGSELSTDNWSVANADPDSYLVEKGGLTIVSSTVGGLANSSASNIFKLKQSLPDSDYTVTVKLRVDFATARDKFAVALYDDQTNYLEATLTSWGGCCSSKVSVGIAKVSNGQTSSFDQPVLSFPNDGDDTFSKVANQTEQPITLKLVKEGHTFHASANFAGVKDDAGNPAWVTTDSVTSLHPPATLVINGAQSDQVTGETTFVVDSVVIDVAGAPAT